MITFLDNAEKNQHIKLQIKDQKKYKRLTCKTCMLKVGKSLMNGNALGQITNDEILTYNVENLRGKNC